MHTLLNTLKLLKLPLKIGISGVILYFLVSQLQGAHFDEILKHLHWENLAQMYVLYLGLQWLSCLRWRVLASSMALPDTLANTFSDYLLGMFYNLFLPTSVGGDIGRAWRLSRRTHTRFTRGFLSTIAERFNGFTILMFYTLIGLIAARPTQWQSIAALVAAIWVVAIAGCFTMPILSKLPIIGPKIVAMAHPKVTEDNSDTEDEELVLPWPTAMAMGQALCLSIVIQLGNISLQWWLAQLLGIKVSFALAAALYGLGGVASMLPLGFSGIGTREGAQVALLIYWVGISSQNASLFSLVWLALLLLATLPGAIIMGLEHFKPTQNKVSTVV